MHGTFSSDAKEEWGQVYFNHVLISRKHSAWFILIRQTSSLQYHCARTRAHLTETITRRPGNDKLIKGDNQLGLPNCVIFRENEASKLCKIVKIRLNIMFLWCIVKDWAISRLSENTWYTSQLFSKSFPRKSGFLAVCSCPFPVVFVLLPGRFENISAFSPVCCLPFRYKSQILINNYVMISIFSGFVISLLALEEIQ